MPNKFDFDGLDLSAYNRLNSRVMDSMDSIYRPFEQISNIINQTNHQYNNSIHTLCASISNLEKQYVSSIAYIIKAMDNIQLSVIEPMQAISQAWSGNIQFYALPMQSMIDNISNVISQYSDYSNYFTNAIDIADSCVYSSMNSIISTLNNTNFEWVNRINDIISNLDYDIIADGSDRYSDDDLNVLVDAFTGAIASTDTLNREQRFMKTYDSLKEKHPVIVKIFISILFFIIASYAGKLLPELPAFIARKPSIVYIEPSSDSVNLLKLSSGECVYIVDSMPYWYSIEYVDEETGESYYGWVAKKNLSE